MPLEYVLGDVVRPRGEGRRIIAHPVNTVRAWGSVLALAISNTHGGQHQDQYVDWMRTIRPQLGATLFTRADNEIIIAHMLVHNGLQSPNNENPLVYAALVKCLNDVFGKATALKATVHTTRIGHGRGGGDWRRIEELMERTAKDHILTIYDRDYQAREPTLAFRRTE